jgi:hypothetical protein
MINPVSAVARGVPMTSKGRIRRRVVTSIVPSAGAGKE